jgi:formate/nitrite transporter FocA (FNT family)
MLGTIVETEDLLDTVVASVVAGVGITAAFAILIFGVARSADMVRDERPLLATAAGGLALIALIVVIASIALGIVVMTSKS